MVWHNWGTGAPNPSVPADGWSARFTGDIAFPATGTYSLDVWTKNGYRVWIDDQLKSDKWLDPNASPAGWAVYETNWYQSGPGFTVTAGAAGERHRIRIETFDSTGESGLRLFWLLNGTWSGVPGTALSPHYGLVTKTTTDDTTPGSPATVTANQFDRPELGLLSRSVEDPAGQALTTSNTYEPEGPGGYFRRTARQMPGGASATYAYYGNTESSSGCGAATNQAGLLKSKTWPTAADGTTLVQQFEYDARGRVRGTRYGAEGWSCTTYDARGRIAERSVLAAGSVGPSSSPGALTYTYSYTGASGSPLQSSAEVCVWDNLACSGLGGAITTTSDLLGRTVSYTDGLGKTSTTTYDAAGRPSDSQTPAGAFHSAYDSQNRNTGYNVNGTSAATMTYTPFEELDTVTYPPAGGGAGPGLSVKYGRDTNGRLNDLWWRDAANATITRDQVALSQSGRVVDETIDGTDANPAGNNFGYDAVGRLVDAEVRGHHLHYGYAASGGCGPASSAGKNSNRTSTTDSSLGGTTATTACYDNADRLVAPSTPGATPITYDSHGNVTSLGGATYVYDGANRHIATIDATTRTNYVKDADDRVVSRTVTNLTGSLSNVGGSTSWNNASTPTTVTPTSWGRSIRLDRPAGSVTGDLLIASVSRVGRHRHRARRVDRHPIHLGQRRHHRHLLSHGHRRRPDRVVDESPGCGASCLGRRRLLQRCNRRRVERGLGRRADGDPRFASDNSLGIPDRHLGQRPRAGGIARTSRWLGPASAIRSPRQHRALDHDRRPLGDGRLGGRRRRDATQSGSSANQTLVLSGDGCVPLRVVHDQLAPFRLLDAEPHRRCVSRVPGGVKANDLIVAAITTSGGTGVTAPAGWTSIRQTTAGGVSLSTFRKTATGTETQEQFGIALVGAVPARASAVEIYRAQMSRPIESSLARNAVEVPPVRSDDLAANDIVLDLTALTNAAGVVPASGRRTSRLLDARPHLGPGHRNERSRGASRVRRPCSVGIVVVDGDVDQPDHRDQSSGRRRSQGAAPELLGSGRWLGRHAGQLRCRRRSVDRPPRRGDAHQRRLLTAQHPWRYREDGQRCGLVGHPVL